MDIHCLFSSFETRPLLFTMRAKHYKIWISPNLNFEPKKKSLTHKTLSWPLMKLEKRSPSFFLWKRFLWTYRKNVKVPLIYDLSKPVIRSPHGFFFKQKTMKKKFTRWQFYDQPKREALLCSSSSCSLFVKNLSLFHLLPSQVHVCVRYWLYSFLRKKCTFFAFSAD